MLASILIILGYAGLYAVIHSWLASLRMKAWARRKLGPASDRWYRLIYNVVAGLMLLPFVPMLAWLPDRTLYALPAPWSWLALAGQLVAALGAVYGLWVTDAWHFLGLRQLIEPAADRRAAPAALTVTGMYAWVRHPVYFWALLFLWLAPRMTVNQATLSLAFSAYLYVGTFFEEQRLVHEFGEAYRHYQRQVPRLIPWRGPVRLPKTISARTDCVGQDCSAD